MYICKHYYRGVFVKIKNSAYLKELEAFGYRYEENLLFPTYRKVFCRCKNKVVIEILIENRIIYINKSVLFRNEHMKYINDLKMGGFLSE